MISTAGRAVHHLDLDANTLRTESFALAQRAVKDTLARQAIGAFYGDAGNGKTFAVRSAIEEITDREVIWIDCPYKLQLKGLAELLLESVNGGVRMWDTRDRIERSLKRELAAEPRVIVIDEAQRLRPESIELLRHYHDDRATRFALHLVGGNDCWRVLSREPMLRSRIYRQVPFAPLSESRVMQLLPRFHPLLTDCSRDVLRMVDRQFAHGNLRNWATFVVTAADICADNQLSTVSDEVVRNVFTLVGGAQ